ncbi:MAG: PH domain-containing protein [Candidatus Aenigmarchaeota archaeon]|nr:PH domain-containing protein [Candidatus Aenigmarchaeota archaeon]
MQSTKIKTSRRSFIWNYSLGIVLFLYLFLSGIVLVVPPLITLFFIFLICLLFIEPEALILYRTFFLDPEGVVEVKGILTKRKNAIPYQNISSEKLVKGIIGRIFNFGNIIIAGYKNEIRINGVTNPEKIYRIIEEKLNANK